MNLLKNTSTPSLVITFFFLVATSISSLYANADELAVPVGHQGAEKAAIDRPKTAMTSSAVEARFGAPLNKTVPVGTPPISSWEYPDYTVYFESDRVIHSVLKPFSETAPAAAPEASTTAPTAVTEPAPAAAEPVPAASSETAAPAAPAETSEAAK